METIRDAKARDPRIEERVAEIRQMLIEMQAIATASALRSLRRAFPHTALTERVRAIAAVSP